MPIGPVMLDIEGTMLTEADKQLLSHPLVGGLIYFSRNYESVEQISHLCSEVRKIRPEILIAVDQEGGRVQRFKDGFTRIPAMQQFLPLYRKQPSAALQLVEDCGWLMATELLSVGVDFSFAPVLDVDDHHCAVIANRSFSPDPEEVTALAGAFMAGMEAAGMATTGKHFPGHGSVVGDSHELLPVDERTMDEIQTHDLIPFKSLMNQLNAIMPAHIMFPQIDSQPVGFSSHWIKRILRKQLGFDGVLFSDDLSMEAATIAGGYAERAEAALRAGCDVALVCNNRQGAQEIIDHLSALAQKDQGFAELIAQQNDRLPLMRAKKTWDAEELTSQERYQKTRTLLAAITQH